MATNEQIMEAFEECLCKSHKYCDKCYQQGPGLGFVCRNNVCLDVYYILKDLSGNGLRRPHKKDGENDG